MFSCPEAERTGHHEAVRQLFRGGREDMDAIVDAINKVVEKHESLRELDHKAIRNLRLSWANRES